jgi:hypothetical protein
MEFLRRTGIVGLDNIGSFTDVDGNHVQVGVHEILLQCTHRREERPAGTAPGRAEFYEHGATVRR